MIASLKSEMTIAYLDDVELGGDARVVANDFQRIEEMGAQIGLTLNRAKCEVIGHDNAIRTFFRYCQINLPETELQDMTMLGSPVPPSQGIDDVLSRKRAKLKRLSTRLPYMPSHDSLYLIPHVVTTPRIMCTLRTSPCTDSNELLRYDETIKSTLPSTMNIKLTESGWRQAVLPVRWGGLGIRSTVQLSPSAYMASAAGAASMLLNILPQRLHGVLDQSMTPTNLAWNKATESADGVPAEQPTTKSQR